MQEFKKGQIVPRRLLLVNAVHKKAQHQIRFMVDVVWDGVSIQPLGEMSANESLIYIPSGLSEPRKNGTRRKSAFKVYKHFSSITSCHSITGSPHKTVSFRNDKTEVNVVGTEYFWMYKCRKCLKTHKGLCL